MAKHIKHRSITGQFSLLLLLSLILGFSCLGSAQDGQKGSPPQEPPKGQGSEPKSGGQSGGGVSTGIGVDVGQVIGLFRHHTQVQLKANTQQVPAGQPVLFTATATPNASGLTYEFHWSKDKDSPGQSEITPSVNHAYSAAGQYTANVVVYSKGKKIATSNDVSITVQQPGPAVSDVRLSLQQNQAKSLNIAAKNNCNQTQRWEVVSQPFPAFMHLAGDWSFDVNAHSKRDFPLEYNSSGLKEGEHEGTVIVRCVTCIPGKCNSVPNIFKVHLTIEPALVAAVPGVGANGTPTPAPPDKPAEPVKTANPPPTVVLPVATPTSAVVPPPVAAPTRGGSNGTLSTAKGDQSQQQNAKGTSAPVRSPSQDQPTGGSTQPVKGPVQAGDAGVTMADGTASKIPDQSGAPPTEYSVSLQTDSHIEAGKPVNFSAQLFPDLPSGKPARYCFSWGDGSAQSCQDSPAAMHVYRVRGKYSASVEVFVDQEKLSSGLQVDAVLPLWLKSLLILVLILAFLAATLGIRKARKMVRAAVSINTDFGHHKISPDVVEGGEGLHIRCVRGAAVSKITFTPSDPLPQENKETANV
ncbi:MAG TPA: PKD domain-containing protein [Candidatus Angelobacter sp.]|nr:PKD domain-containing protein [Candidatus Angelobacter sp.]